jgi:hypothetical protein
MPEVKVELNQINNNVSIDETNVNVNLTEQVVNVDLGTSGPQGPRGTGLLNGVGAPSAGLGISGDFYLNTSNMNLYGPKTESGWGSPTDLVGSQELGYVHIQENASATWSITHGLGFVPNITVVDTAGTVVEGSYNYPNSNTVVLTFIGAFSGRAYLS